jgi:hypothetical protein
MNVTYSCNFQFVPSGEFNHVSHMWVGWHRWEDGKIVSSGSITDGWPVPSVVADGEPGSMEWAANYADLAWNMLTAERARLDRQASQAARAEAVEEVPLP